MAEIRPEIMKSLKRNIFANLLDGGFFGLALGFSSFITVLPLFVSTLTDSPILIGLIPAIHMIGWQLPQLLTVRSVSRQRRFKPMVMLMTIHERLPFLGLAIVAFFSTAIDPRLTLFLTFLMLIWQGLGGGFTATAWQSMIGKIIPSNRRGTFYGAQSAAANLLSSLSAVLAGVILERLSSPTDYSLLFLLAGLSMGVSYFFLSMTIEPENAPVEPEIEPERFWHGLRTILREDRNFRWFLAARMLSQLAVMGFAFYTVYGVRNHGLSEGTVGIMTAVMLGAEIAVNPLVGWMGDKWSHRAALSIGVAAAATSAFLAWWAPGPSWFYLIFATAGIAYAALWTASLAMILEFGSETQRPAYIGLANTLIAPATILAPFLGGWLADIAGYPAAFLASLVSGLATLAVLQIYVKDPRGLPKGIPVQTEQEATCCD